LLKTSPTIRERLDHLRRFAEREASRVIGQRQERDQLLAIRSNHLAKGERPDPSLAQEAERADAQAKRYDQEAHVWSLAHRTAAAWLDTLPDDTWLVDTGWRPLGVPPAFGSDPRAVLGVVLEGEAPERRPEPVDRGVSAARWLT
jgi:hypothetical protein